MPVGRWTLEHAPLLKTPRPWVQLHSSTAPHISKRSMLNCHRSVMQCAAQQQQKLIWGVNGEQLEHKTTSFVLCGCCEAWKDEEQVELFFFCILDVSLPSSCSLYTCFAFQSCFFKVLRRRSALEAPRIMFCHLLPSSFFNDPARKQKNCFVLQWAPIQRGRLPESVGERKRRRNGNDSKTKDPNANFFYCWKWALEALKNGLACIFLASNR